MSADASSSSANLVPARVAWNLRCADPTFGQPWWSMLPDQATSKQKQPQFIAAGCALLNQWHRLTDAQREQNGWLVQTQQYVVNVNVPHTYFYVLHRSSINVIASAPKRQRTARGPAADAPDGEDADAPPGFIKLSMTGGGSVHYFAQEGTQLAAKGHELVHVRASPVAMRADGRATSAYTAHAYAPSAVVIALPLRSVRCVRGAHTAGLPSAPRV